MKTLTYQIFGSPSSKDYDILVFVKELKTIQENHEQVTELESLFKNKFNDKPLNVNIGVVKDGQLIEVFKGYPFEVNNSCYYTYNYHNQDYSNMIDKPYVLNNDVIYYKLKRCFRFILSFYSRIPEFRNDIKEAMRGDLLKRTECIKKIKIHEHREFTGKKDSSEDIYKTFAFQLGQTYLMTKGIEAYTKEAVYKELPMLECALCRLHLNMNDYLGMQSILIKLIDYSYNEMKYMKTLDEVL